MLGIASDGYIAYKNIEEENEKRPFLYSSTLVHIYVQGRP